MIRVQKKEKFVVLDKTCSIDNKLSWKAKGLHTYLMGLPDGWVVSIVDLAQRSRDGHDSTLAGIKELIQAGYLKLTQARQDNGRFSKGDYIVYETPQRLIDGDENMGELPALSDTSTSPQPENPVVVPRRGNPVLENPGTVYPAPVKQQLLNNNINKYLNNKKTAAMDEAQAVDVKTIKFAAAENFSTDNLRITS